MSNTTEHHAGELNEVMRSLADVWPNDRNNVMVAGAKFEEIIEELEFGGKEFQKLIDLAWSGLKHLYENDEFFLSVKTATMGAVNTIREYLIQDGDIAVEDFERSYEQLERALAGEHESADKVLEPDEYQKQKGANTYSETVEGTAEEESAVKTDLSLNDLASFIMTLDEENITDKDREKITEILKALTEKAEGQIELFLSEALAKVADASKSNHGEEKDWLSFVAEKTEQAIEVEEDESWNIAGAAESGPMEEKTGQEPRTREESQKEVFYMPEDTDPVMLGEFVTECFDLIETAESALLELETSPDDEELINTVFRAFHTIKGTSAFMGLEPISEFTHSAENLLNMVRDGDLPFDMACADITLESIDILKKMLDAVERASAEDPLHTDQKYDRMTRILHHICDDAIPPKEALQKEGGTPQPSPKEIPLSEAGEKEESPQEKLSELTEAPSENGERNSQKPEADATVRVNVGRLDRLIDMVGELVIAHSVVAQDESIARNSGLMKKVTHTSKILRELQDTSLTLRMIPMKATFHKMNRLVRDLARKAGKSVRFSTIGEDTEIDRNMVDIINEPLVHMLRNAIDHGIEDTKEREETDKPATANVWLRAFQEGGKVVIEIEDDGKGIDKEKILKKAIEKELVDPEKQLSDSEIFSLIFLPGFSSVDKVTDLSGRGVGMDVVRRSIEQLNGKVEVSSTKGKGTKVSIELPFTLAITDGMLVRIGEQRFIIPTLNIDMTFRAEEKDLYTVLGNSEQVNFRGKSVPIIRLHKLFNISGAIEEVLDGTLLVIRNNNKQYALLVDEVIGQQQLVGKSINMIVKAPHVSGGAILGDGQVGLILDTASVVN